MALVKMVASPERLLARHIADLTVSRIPAETRRQIPHLLVDTLSCVLAGLRSDQCRRIAALYLDRAGRPESSIAGSEQRLPAPAAAMVNAVLAHWFEWDDVHDAGATHPSAVLIPALLAAAEAHGNDDDPSSAASFVATAVATYDVAGWLGSALTPLSKNGWMPTGIACEVAAAGGVARLAGLGEDGIAAAMAIAAAGAGLSRQPLIDKVSGKNVLCGIAASRALDAAYLARAGVAGASNYLTGEFGLNALFAENRASLAVEISNLGIRFTVDEISLKPYPCCRAAHLAIDLALDLRSEGGIDVNEIVGVEVAVPQPMFELCGAPFVPGDDPRVSAQFSIPYTTALALQHGLVHLLDFAPEKVLGEAPILDLARRIVVDGRKVLPGVPALRQPVTLRILQTDGTVIERTSSQLRGTPERPMSTAERIVKLADAAQGALDLHAVKALQVAASTIERAGITQIMHVLRSARWHEPAMKS